MMDYIYVHKPNVTVSTKTLNTPRRKSTSRKSTNQKKEINLLNDFFDPTQLSFKAFEQKLDDTKQKIHEDLFESIYESTNEYFEYYLKRRIECSHGNSKMNVDEEDEKLIFNPICHVIPTIALFTGINFQDYASLCERLTNKLETKFTKYVFYISEKNSQNIKSLTNSIYFQWEKHIFEEQKTKKKMFSFRGLFEDINKTNSETKEINSIIFVLKQFELIPKETVEQFVSLVSCYVENIPIYFIIELASQSNILYEQLSSAVISKLCIKKLYLMSPELFLDKFLTKLFIQQSTLFRLSGDILKYLVETYYEYNFSITSLIHALKFCYYDHLQQHKFAQFYLTPILTEWELFERQIELSKKKDIEEKVIYDSLATCMDGYQTNWIQENNQFSFMCQILFEIVRNFPSDQEEESFFNNDIKSFIDFYVKMSSLCKMNSNKKSFMELSQYTNLKSLIRIASVNTINDIVVSIIELIKSKPIDNELSYSVNFLNDVHDFEEILERIKQNFSATINETSFNEDDENTLENTYTGNKKKENENFNLQSVLHAKVSVVRRRSSRSSRVLGELNSTEQLKTLESAITKPKVPIVSKKTNLGNIKVLTQKMIEWLDTHFSQYFNRDYSVDLQNSNYFCYSNLEMFQNRLFDMQRLNVHNCLFNTNDFFKLKINGNTSDDSPNKRAKHIITSNDLLTTNNEDHVPLSVIYRIYLECGHMINLFDWLQSFVDRTENADLKELSESKRKRMQALFFRSITELQFMGFIKPTNRKVDHVVKLTNGSSLLTVDDFNYKIKLNYH